ncbi:uncharacterized protein MONOS_11991 [Monocercomonoides exilis]|uniref:uncharacterized protein n=1 Tax=Monocercomonoides exilis TaxID=2049356 RepID=UPI00355AB6E7|nr:hypothetical protein MONOS_11991 [Monocercomonoides exilis]|eukprot:MONOS_11991.1-p1 / transcript=MONOS_11991.1 / gene=MONOS_11991 / organism=Monocercomonoides_exilis_PA203 / gene_product=unspecified product / transcript_product=unspecified product / location=Mono_scaffold00633:34151-35263(-) / protein_length=371 / sequence_SO=supercontig / SO=protein_coding / is_pseudo=false
MQSSSSHFPDDNIQKRHHHRHHHHHHHHHKDLTGRHHQKNICPIHSSSSSSRVMFRRCLPLTRTQTVIISQQSQAVSSTRHFVPSKKIFVVNALLFDLPNQSVSQTQQQPYSSTSSSFSPSSISPLAASSIRLMQLMQLTRGINRKVTINETERQFPQKILGDRVLNSASTQPIAQRIHPIILCGDLSAPLLEDPALRFLLQGVETQTHPSLCDSGVVPRALTAPSMANENVEMADTTEKMKRKEVLPKRIGCARALWRRERRLRQENDSAITSTLPHLDSLTPTTSSSSSSSSSSYSNNNPKLLRCRRFEEADGMSFLREEENELMFVVSTAMKQRRAEIKQKNPTYFRQMKQKEAVARTVLMEKLKRK